MAFSRRSSRRTMLGGAIAATGLAGTGLALKASGDRSSPSPTPQEAAATAAPAAPALSTLFLDRYSIHTSERGRGIQRKKGDQTLMRGTLTTDAGERVGEIFANSVTMPGPMDVDMALTPRMEIQNLHLVDGTILAMGTAFAQVDLPNIYTIIGGSGRYAGLRGGYTFDNNPSVASPEGRATITFDVTP